ncbi:MAG: DUF5105 domain-containing protein [Lachnospiraceae bacterium]|jgi:hypothetical protein|nr:DUF5105 domain-containing protein [Lachnospiraceae bacterium]
MKKIFPILFYIGLCLPLIAACNEPKTNAAESIKAIYDLYILGDTQGITSLGMTDEDISNARKIYDDSLKETIRANFAASGQEIEETTLNKLCDARKEALSKMEASSEITAESEGKATVVIHTTYFDESTLDSDAYYEAREETKKNGFSDLEEQRAFLMKLYTKNLIKAYQNVTPSKDTTDITVDCVIQNKTWVPANMSSFGSDLAQAITGQH